ncbi:3-hydroxyacyl-CoA dehydrogenase NAD-binding domain-containing protein [Defluviimonas sp. SAOS-178_SWC]|uniref:3-hydroxyacyl-CoA dehydrogenase NAD-binding domain-containing protein n=1 Tax=Defluviimonas sp. SAOS-178_SWC TaxID=3121287 RepID=UPI0032218D91
MKAPIKHVTCIGCGVIGAGWVVHFLRSGLDVVAYDLDSEKEKYIRAMIDEAWPYVRSLGLAEGASSDRWRFTTDLGEAVASANLIQESAVENEAMKIDLLRQIGDLAPVDAIIASSSSGFLAARLRHNCKAGDRFLIAHPFNPPYMIPLVELAGADGLAPGVLDRATEFYRSTTMHPVVLNREIRGYIGNRIQASVFREVLHLIQEGVATAEDIDAAIKYGPGLRWALMGPTEIYGLGSGGAKGWPFFLQLLMGELEDGYATPGDFKPDESVLKKYSDDAMRIFDSAAFQDLCARRDRGLVQLRNLVAEIDRANSGASPRVSGQAVSST